MCYRGINGKKENDRGGEQGKGRRETKAALEGGNAETEVGI